MEIQPSTVAEAQWSALPQKLLGRLVDSSWAGAEVNGLGCQTELFVELVSARLGRDPNRQIEQTTIWQTSWREENLDKVGVVLNNNSRTPTENSKRPFIWVLFFFLNIFFPSLVLSSWYYFSFLIKYQCFCHVLCLHFHSEVFFCLLLVPPHVIHLRLFICPALDCSQLCSPAVAFQ